MRFDPERLRKSEKGVVWGKLEEFNLLTLVRYVLSVPSMRIDRVSRELLPLEA